MTLHYHHYTAKDFSTDEAFIDWVLLSKEATAWNNWLQQYPEKNAEVAEAKLLVLSFHQAQEEASSAQINKVWESIQQSIHHTQQPKVVRLSTGLKQLLRIAAIVLLVVGAAVISFTLYQRSQTITYTTVYGQTKNISLPDGSSVMLNANSELSFKKGWEKNAARDVVLKGEAYFTVQHLKNNQPFVVHASDDIAIRVLGTEFNVSNRHNDVKVLLNKGRIQLEQTLAGATDTLIVKPGELVQETVGKKLKKQQLAATETHEVLAWKEQKIAFSNADIPELKAWLKDNHNISLVINDNALQNIRFNGEFPADNWKIVIAAMETTYGLTATYNNDEVILQPR